MNAYCRVVDGKGTDVCYGENAELAITTSFVTEYIEEVGGVPAWLPIQDGVTVNGGWLVTVTDGVVTASVAPSPPPPVPKTINKQEYNDVCIGALGGIPAGVAAFQAVIDAAVAAGGAARGTITYYNGANTFTLPQTQAFFVILVDAQCCTQEQADAVIAAWPMVAS